MLSFLDLISYIAGDYIAKQMNLTCINIVFISAWETKNGRLNSLEKGQHTYFFQQVTRRCKVAELTTDLCSPAPFSQTLLGYRPRCRYVCWLWNGCGSLIHFFLSDYLAACLQTPAVYQVKASAPVPPPPAAGVAVTAVTRPKESPKGPAKVDSPAAGFSDSV